MTYEEAAQSSYVSIISIVSTEPIVHLEKEQHDLRQEAETHQRDINYGLLNKGKQLWRADFLVSKWNLDFTFAHSQKSLPRLLAGYQETRWLNFPRASAFQHHLKEVCLPEE